MREAISPSIGLTLWSMICIIVLTIAFLWLAYFIFKKKKKSTALNIASALLLMGSMQSCDLKHDESVSPVSTLITEYNVKVISKDEMPASALHFSTTEEARSFLKELDKSGLTPNAELLAAYKKGLPSITNTQNSYHPAPWDDPELPSGDPLDPAGVGSGIFSQAYMPWNNLEATLHWNNGHLTNLTTQLQGISLGLNWIQTGWQDTGYHNGSYTFIVTYHVDVVMFVEGVGTVYTGASHVGYGTYNPSTGQGGVYTTP